METSFYLLLLIAHLGAFDVVYFHIYKCRLHERPECRREVFWHVCRHLIYALQFVWIANFRFHGWALLLLAALYAADVIVAWADVLEETESRRAQGGLPRGEYFMHVALSVLIGLYLMATFQAVWPDRALDTAIALAPPDVPFGLRLYMTGMGIVAFLVFIWDLRVWISDLPKPKTENRNPNPKIIVEAIIPCDVATVWERSQNPALHLLWDLRFSHIEYLDARDRHGFRLMDYRTKIGFGLEIKGLGRYLQNAPLKHSTFEFESSDWKSLIRIGRGIWQYRECAGGTYFRTVYDYETNYGALGRLVDRALFRPVMQLATEWSFESLRRWCEGREEELTTRRSYFKFIPFFVKRYFGFAPKKGAAASRLGSGRETRLRLKLIEETR